MRIAVIGSGISGLAAAWLLNRRHEVRVFEEAKRVGGHTHTVVVRRGERDLALDTGFLVFNRSNYPNLTRLFDTLSVPAQETDMSFAVSCARCDWEYGGVGLASLVAQKRNLLRPRFYRMLLDVLRFGAVGRRQLQNGGVGGVSLGEYLVRGSFGVEFGTHYLLPMAAALWSSGTETVEEFPAESLLRFFDNHGLLRIRDRKRWMTVRGGSHVYVRALTRDFAHRIHTGMPVRGVARTPGGVRLFFEGGRAESFDRVVIATHADQALHMLCDPSKAELELLSPWRYSRNETWLHTDIRQLPRRRAAWGSWNYLLADCRDFDRRVSASYYLNLLQGLDEDQDYVVTLNPDPSPDRARVLARMVYRHPIFTSESVATQSELPGLNGDRGTHFCGAYFGYGFHEDGLNSALRVADAFGISL